MESKDELCSSDFNHQTTEQDSDLETDINCITESSYDILQTLIETVDSDISMSHLDSCKDNLLSINASNELNVDVLLNSIDNLLNSASQANTNSELINNDYGKRKLDEHEETKRLIKKGHHYKESFKRKVLDYAVRHTFRETAAKFHINPNTLTEWAREYKRLLMLKKDGQKAATCLKSDRETSDVKFLKWLREQREATRMISREEIIQVGHQFLDNNAPKWYRLWLSRFSDNKISVDGATGKYIKYPTTFKLEVALFAREFRERTVANTFNVSTRRIYEWQDDLKKSARTGRSICEEEKRKVVEAQLLAWLRGQSGKIPKTKEIRAKARILYSEIGMSHIKCSKGWMEKIKKRLDLKLKSDWDDLLLWILQLLDNHSVITLAMVADKAKQVALQNNRDFKGSKNWTLRFLKQHSHILQNTSARLSDMPQSAVTCSQEFVMAVREEIKKSPGSIVGCMDEILIKFSPPTDKKRTPCLLRRANFESAQAVVLLTATSDGQLLQPAVVLRGSQSSPKHVQYHNGMPFWYRNKLTVDEDLLKEWTDHLWLRKITSPSILIVDAFKPHTSSKLLEKLSEQQCTVKVIPLGCAVFLQPFAFNLSRKFQEVVQEAWEEYIVDEEHLNGFRVKGPTDVLILTWIHRAHQALQADSNSIRNSFIVSGLIASDVRIE